jgi:hypothetical protein
MSILHLTFESMNPPPPPFFFPFLFSCMGVNSSEPYISGEYVLGSVLMAFGLSLGVYGGFVMDCIFTMCDYLDINCLTVKKKRVEKAVKPGNFKEI